MSLRPFARSAALDIFERLTSRKLWMVIFCCSVPWAGLERGVKHLYALTPQAAAVYGGMFLCVMGAITVIVGKYMGVAQTSLSSATSVAGLITAAAQTLVEKRESHEIIETLERVVDEGAPGAPARRPFAPDAEHDVPQ